MKFWPQTLFIVGVILTVNACGGDETSGPVGGAPDGAASESAPIPRGSTAVGAFNFSLADQPALEQTQELDSLSEGEQKAIYFELKSLIQAAARDVYAADLSTDEAVAALQRVEDKSYYATAKEHGLTVAQLHKINVPAQRFKWGR